MKLKILNLAACIAAVLPALGAAQTTPPGRIPVDSTGVRRDVTATLVIPTGPVDHRCPEHQLPDQRRHSG